MTRRRLTPDQADELAAISARMEAATPSTRLHFPDLCAAADAYSEDPDRFVAVFLVGPPAARDVDGNRWYVSSVENDDDCQSLEAVFCPERGGRVYSVSELLNDPGLRVQIRRAAAVRLRVSAERAGAAGNG